MRTPILFLLINSIFIIFSSLLFGYQHNFMTIHSPSTLYPKQLVFGIEHRFLGPATEDTIDTLFGSDIGANIALKFRYKLTDSIELDYQRIRDQKEHTTGIKVKVPTPLDIDTQVEGYYVTLSETNKTGGVFVVSLKPKKDVFLIKPVVNIVSETVTDTSGIGIGLEFMQSDRISYFTELFTPENDSPAAIVGVKIGTFGHRFMLTLQNTNDIGLRNHISGTSEDDLFLGFSIQRIFDL
jgi:hypothetical protein